MTTRNTMMERKGPHKSMHCKFCRPEPTTPDRLSQSHIETTTRLRLMHEGADVELRNVSDEPGMPSPESAVCICQLEDENKCCKCAPDKNRRPLKKEICDCPEGAKPHASMMYPAGETEHIVSTRNRTKKVEDDDDEFWWEKEERRRAAIVADKWVEFMAQIKERARLEKKMRKMALLQMGKLQTPKWYHTLSPQQITYLEHLAMAIRLDSDENVTDRTNFIISGIGLYPKPSRKLLRGCIRHCHYNALVFLIQLLQLIKTVDPFNERVLNKKIPRKGQNPTTWNERLLMTLICHLELPQILRELMDRLPQLPQEPLLAQIPYPKYPKRRKKKKNCSPYEEPQWQEQLNWIEKDKIDRVNRCRAHMDCKRVKVPKLALQRRVSLIDARPPFLAQIEANERAARRQPVEQTKNRPPRKHPVTTFDSAVDVTAIAAIEPSEVSTEKPDEEDVCMFLRSPAKPESIEGEELKDIMYPGEMRGETSEEDPPELHGEGKTELDFPPRPELFFRGEGTSEETVTSDHMPFKTPPKTESGKTIGEPCPAPVSSPSPQGKQFEEIKRHLDVINEEICCFNPGLDDPEDDEAFTEFVQVDVTEQLKKAAKKLKKLHDLHDDSDEEKKKKKKRKIKRKHCKNNCECRICSGKLKTRIKPRKKECKTVKLLCFPVEDEVQKSENEEVKLEVFTEPIAEKQEIGHVWKCTELPPERKKKRRVSSQKKRKVGGKVKTKLDIRNEDERKQDNELMVKDNGTMTGSILEQVENTNKPETQEAAVYYGDVISLVKNILADLLDEGYHCPGFKEIEYHPDIQQLLKFLKGEILHDRRKEKLWNQSIFDWMCIEKFSIYKNKPPAIPIPDKRQAICSWEDKKWVSAKINKVKQEYYFQVAKNRAASAKDFYPSLYQDYFGSDNFLKIYFSYFVARYEDNVMKGMGQGF